MVTYLLPSALQPLQLIRETLITSHPVLPDSLIPVPFRNHLGGREMAPKELHGMP